MSATSRRRPGSSARHPHQISRGFAWLAIGALSAGTLAACGSSSASSASGSSGGKSTYTIHAILSVTGRNSFLGVDEKASLQGLQKLVNSTGGIDRKSVVRERVFNWV